MWFPDLLLWSTLDTPVPFLTSNRITSRVQPEETRQVWWFSFYDIPKPWLMVTRQINVLAVARRWNILPTSFPAIRSINRSIWMTSREPRTAADISKSYEILLHDVSQIVSAEMVLSHQPQQEHTQTYQPVPYLDNYGQPYPIAVNCLRQIEPQSWCQGRFASWPQNMLGIKVRRDPIDRDTTTGIANGTRLRGHRMSCTWQFTD
jgi:hypothetical protein